MRRLHNGITGKICDCPKERRAKCPHPWHFNGGRDFRFSVDVQMGRHIASYTEACKLAKGWLEEIGHGTFVRRERGAQIITEQRHLTHQGPTLDAFAATYLQQHSLLKSAGKELKDRQHRDFYVFQPLLKFILPDGRRMGDLPFAGITEAMYEEYISARRDEDYAVSTVNKDINLIRGMCRWAHRRGWFGKGLSPISGESAILKLKPNTRRRRVVTDAELDAIRNACDWQLWAYVKLSFITCARLTELYRLKWDDLYGTKIRIRPEATKVYTAERWLPLDEEAMGLLEGMRTDPAGNRYDDDDFIFGQMGVTPRSIKDRFKTMLLKAFPAVDAAGNRIGIDWQDGVHGPDAQKRLDDIDLLFSDFRHEGALRKYRGGWLLNEIQRLLGHTNLEQTSTYLGVGNEEVMRAMERYGSGFPSEAKVPTQNSITNPDDQTMPIRDGKSEKRH